MNYTIDQYRKFRARWAVLAIVTSLIGILSVWGSQALWSYQDSQSAKTEHVNWLIGAGGGVCALIGFGCIIATFLCADKAYKMDRKIQAKRVRGRMNRIHAHPCKHEPSQVGSS